MMDTSFLRLCILCLCAVVTVFAASTTDSQTTGQTTAADVSSTATGNNAPNTVANTQDVSAGSVAATGSTAAQQSDQTGSSTAMRLTTTLVNTNDMTTVDSETDVNDTHTSVTVEPTGVTVSQKVHCYLCHDGEDCETKLDENSTCTSSNGACFVSYHKENGTVKRDCKDPNGNMTKSCSSPFPSHTEANDHCLFCCTGETCNTYTDSVLKENCKVSGSSRSGENAITLIMVTVCTQILYN